jgi:hypothetical protein
LVHIDDLYDPTAKGNSKAECNALKLPLKRDQKVKFDAQMEIMNRFWSNHQKPAKKTDEATIPVHTKLPDDLGKFDSHNFTPSQNRLFKDSN